MFRRCAETIPATLPFAAILCRRIRTTNLRSNSWQESRDRRRRRVMTKPGRTCTSPCRTTPHRRQGRRTDGIVRSSWKRSSPPRKPNGRRLLEAVLHDALAPAMRERPDSESTPSQLTLRTGRLSLPCVRMSRRTIVANTFDRITQNPNVLAGRATVAACASRSRTSSISWPTA